jgi:signal transduction histidine kinase
MPFRSRATTRYLVAVALVVVVTLLRLPLGSLLGNSVPFILYFPAIVMAGWFGGLGPGLVATLLSGYCAKTWFFEPVGSFEIPNWASAFRLLLFLASGALMSFLCGKLHRRTQELAKEKVLLEERVSERTRHLENALRDMESFSYTVSHDVRGPLRVMVGYADVLLEDEGARLTPEAREYLRRIHDAATRLGRLADDLLTFAKVSGATIQTERVVLPQLVAEILRDVPPLLGGAGVIDTTGCIHAVMANPTLLLQAIQNLFENAAKFIAPGVAPQIRVWSERHGPVVRLWVADNGIGIAPEHLQRLFKLFERVEPSQYVGTGIGLSIVERAVSKMNGRVGVESTPGAGSRFWIELPAAEGEARPVAINSARGNVSADAPGKTPRRTAAVDVRR